MTFLGWVTIFGFALILTALALPFDHVPGRGGHRLHRRGPRLVRSARRRPAHRRQMAPQGQGQRREDGREAEDGHPAQERHLKALPAQQGVEEVEADEGRGDQPKQISATHIRSIPAIRA